ncbi:MAG: hypothetical protein KDE31_33500 [Caldilineaceae bacterium]|nr:hypothetical protein [Caldilineaceae bacterium]MCB0189250.1 hypothetical protein [Caldilineaceae bacterium]
MKHNRFVQLSWVLLALMTLASAAWTQARATAPSGTIVETLRQDLVRFQKLEVAKEEGYGLFHGCMSSPQSGAMGVHFVNGDLVGDGEVDALHPEALLYQPKDGKMQLVGVEYLVFAEAWDANHEGPPMVMGHMFNFTSAPNRLRIPAFYSLHVWAWQSNPSGTFSDFNPKVSCDGYISDAAMDAHH